MQPHAPGASVLTARPLSPQHLLFSLVPRDKCFPKTFLRPPGMRQIKPNRSLHRPGPLGGTPTLRTCRAPPYLSQAHPFGGGRSYGPRAVGSEIGRDLRPSQSCPHMAVQTQGHRGEFGVSGSPKDPGWGPPEAAGGKRLFPHCTKRWVLHV